MRDSSLGSLNIICYSDSTYLVVLLILERKVVVTEPSIITRVSTYGALSVLRYPSFTSIEFLAGYCHVCQFTWWIRHSR